jgi:hypothetical protein
MDKHTPGPWRAEPWKYENGKRTVLTIQTNTDAIAQVLDLWCPDDRAAETEANARLIAAAPRMLEIIERALPLLVRLGDFIGNGDVDPTRPDSLGVRCDVIGDARAILRDIESAS